MTDRALTGRCGRTLPGPSTAVWHELGNGCNSLLAAPLRFKSGFDWRVMVDMLRRISRQEKTANRLKCVTANVNEFPRIAYSKPGMFVN